MRHIRKLKKYIRDLLLDLIPTSTLEKVEDLVQLQLGKGSGAWTNKSETRAIADFVKLINIGNVVAIDAGANLGDWTSELLNCLPKAKVFAFEPSKAAFDHLDKRFLSDQRVTTFNYALGKDNKYTTLFADKSGSGLASLTNRRLRHFDINFKHQERVQVKTLDSWMDSRNTNLIPNILKMDVEGHEYDLLLGAKETLKNILIVQFEFGGSNIDTRTYFQDFWYFFEDLGFKIYRLRQSKPLPINNYSERDETFRATNYIAIRKNDTLSS